jgi:hypothetical protein
MSELKVYDSVWIMRNNKPKEMKIYSIIEEPTHNKKGTQFRFGLVETFLGKLGPDIALDSNGFFKSKQELLNSFLV